MDIIVCIKQVPDPVHFSRISLDPATKTITREGIPVITNPWDKNALEEGLRIRERSSGKVVVLSMGPPQTRKSLEEALAMGADEAFLLCDRAFAASDTLATAYTLARGIQKIGHFDLILCGNETVDSGTGQVGPQLAQFLGIPCVTSVNEISFEEERKLIVKRGLERGHMKVKLELPALLAIGREINKPRLITAFGIMQAAETDITVWGCEDIGAEPDSIGVKGSPMRIVATFQQHPKHKGEIMTGPPEEVVNKTIEKLRELGGLI
ncbi:MAG: electron transfer flavoprotein subunit beta/FixA family protein [Dehalococcoidia bacterium]|nr:electron transfer flavoprotein subunit beta/FixA family protein [Dehalococcoidia bacterium]